MIHLNKGYDGWFWIATIIAILLIAALIIQGYDNAEYRTKEVKFQEKVNELELQIEQLKQINTTKDVTEKKVITAKPKIVQTYYPAGCEKYKAEISKYGWNVSVAMAVMYKESGCRSHALSPWGDRGLFQINSVHASKVNYNLNSLFDPNINTKVAYQIYLSSGWSAWSVCNTGVVKCW